MSNRVLWTIDNELDGRTFERLCVDLLYRNGYRDIVPIEPQDGGRDAEELPRRGRGRAGEATFFQFSLEKGWKGKLRRDARKLDARGIEFSTFVFVTIQKARGVDVDLLTTELRRKYGWQLIAYSREWLRLQLEEAHPDLAKKYLDVEIPTWAGQGRLSSVVRLPESADKRLSEAWAALEAGAYERAAAELKDFLAEQPESDAAWQALAWSQYCAYHFDEALASINRALKLKNDPQALSIRACILAEKGIKEGSKTAVIEARRLFEELLESMQAPAWQMLYNMGNILSALGEHQDAITYYQRAVKLENHEPTIWKNLASVYHLVGDHPAEMECFDKALELDPLKPETLVSKGVSLLIDFGKPEEAASLLECALKSSPDWAVQWPHIWYWLAEAYRKSGSLQSALYWVEDGLMHQPGHLALRRLKSEILAGLLAQDTGVVQEARRFWKAQVMEQPLDYEARSRLARLELQEGNESAAWELLQESLDLVRLHPVVPLRTSRFDLEDCIAAFEFLPQYVAFRGRYPIADYWNSGDPLYGLPFAPPVSGHIEGALTTSLSVPFGLGVKYLNENPVAREGKETLIGFFETLRPRIERALIEAAREFARLIPPREQGPEAVANKVTEIIMFLGLVALREFGRQRGWIVSQFLVPSGTLNGALDCYDETLIETNVVSNSVLTLNEEAGFAPDSD
jgi:tetratricopeptide (TPR) repeat protein